MDRIIRSARSEAADAGGRSIVVTASDDSVDRYGDRILVDGKLNGRKYGSGWQLDAFKRNPVVLLSHDMSEPPVGQVAKLWTDAVGSRKRLRAEILFSRSNPVADVVLGLFREKAMRAVSVGFISLAQYMPTSKEREKLGLGPFGQLHATSELLELSTVTVPANAGAIVEGLGTDGRQALAELAAVASRYGCQSTAMHIRSFLAARAPRDAEIVALMNRNLHETLGGILERHGRQARAADIAAVPDADILAMARASQRIERLTHSVRGSYHPTFQAMQRSLRRQLARRGLSIF